MNVQPKPFFEARLNEDHKPSLLAGILSALSADYKLIFCHVMLVIFVKNKSWMRFTLLSLLLQCFQRR